MSVFLSCFLIMFCPLSARFSNFSKLVHSSLYLSWFTLLSLSDLILCAMLFAWSIYLSSWIKAFNLPLFHVLLLGISIPALWQNSASPLLCYLELPVYCVWLELRHSYTTLHPLAFISMLKILINIAKPVLNSWKWKIMAVSGMSETVHVKRADWPVWLCAAIISHLSPSRAPLTS